MEEKKTITHVIISIDTSTGGPARSVTHLIHELLKSDSKISVGIETLLSSNPIIETFNNTRGSINFNKSNKFGYSKSLRQALKNSSTDIFHGHGLWQLPVNTMAKFARKRFKPYIISTRGMLEPWALQQRKLKKKLALQLFQYKDLAKATCLHATASMEVESIRNLGFKNPIAMIPNGVNISEFNKIAPVKTTAPKKILFLSRIHPKKGIENLVKAWSQVDILLRKNWQIEIIGNGEKSYINNLQLQINELQLHQQISISPPVFGKEKIKNFREASLFVLPTYSENFGIVVAEALASYTPVITTNGTPWGELNTHNAGWWIDIGVKPLKNALEVAMQTKASELFIMGENGRKLIEDKYSMEAVAKQMLELYQWILKKGEKPNFIN